MGLKRRVRKLIRRYTTTPEDDFHSDFYLRITQRRLEHLAHLGLDLSGQTVLEVGAGMGDLTSFFTDRDCRVRCTEPRGANLKVLQARFVEDPNVDVGFLDLNAPVCEAGESYEIVYCYGVLYHLEHPVEALAFLAGQCNKLMLVEGCVTPGNEEALNPVREDRHALTQGISGRGCRPTRAWIMAQLRKHFAHVYVPTTQPNHLEYPIDWDAEPTTRLTRATFVASRQPLDNPLLTKSLPMRQSRH